MRQLVQAGQYKTGDAAAQKLVFRDIAPTPGHLRPINLVVFNDKTAALCKRLVGNASVEQKVILQGQVNQAIDF